MSTTARMAARRPLAAICSKEASLWARGVGRDCRPPSPPSAVPTAALLLSAGAAATLCQDRTEDTGSPPQYPWRTAGIASTISASTCRCDAHAFAHGGPGVMGGQAGAGVSMGGPGLLSIKRRRTIRRMENEANRQSVESRYAIDPTPLGVGSYGEVYLATDRATGEKIALKKISKEHTNDEVFQREMTVLLHIRSGGGHPHVCALRENFDEGDYYYLTLDLIQGGELFDHLIDYGAFSEADAARLVREVASALDFLHGIGVVHADMKPENIMLSSRKESHAAIKLVDFGCAEVQSETDNTDSKRQTIQPGTEGGTTPAYCPPESFDGKGSFIEPSMDMWAVGIILYIMLCGAHPFDLDGTASDEEIERRIKTIRRPPLEGSEFTEHLSPSAIDLLSKLMAEDPKQRISANEMLQHPWVRGDTARTNIMEGSAKRLSKFRQFKTKIQVEAFKHLVSWSNDGRRRHASERGKSLMERAFSSLDLKEVGEGSGKESEEEAGHGPMTLSDFSDLLGADMKEKFFPRGHIVYREGDPGDKMYFINSGAVQVSTIAGFQARLGQGDSFGEGGLLNTNRARSATIKCATPVHAIEIDEECFKKYLSSSDSKLAHKMKEKVKMHKFGRAEYQIATHENLRDVQVGRWDLIFKEGDEVDGLYVVKDGKIDVRAKGHSVYSLKPGDIFGAQSFVVKRPRKASAVCLSDKCNLKKLGVEDANALLQSSPSVMEAVHELCLRREFQRAIVLKLKTNFPSSVELKKAFDALDLDHSGELELVEVRELLKSLGKTLSEEDLKTLVTSLDLDGSGTVSFDEFQSVFGRD